MIERCLKVLAGKEGATTTTTTSTMTTTAVRETHSRRTGDPGLLGMA